MNSSPTAPARRLEQQIWTLAERGDMKQAIASCQDLNQRYPDYAPGWRSASHLAQRLKNPKMALNAIDRAVALEPDNLEWLLHRAQCLANLGRIAEARPLAHQLARAALKNAYQHSTLGLLLSRLGQDEAALEQYRKAQQLEPNDAGHHYNAATVERFLGDFEASEKSLALAIRANPQEYEAYSLRSDLRRQSPDNNHVAELEALLKKGISDSRGEVRICYALAKELEDIGDSERSFSALKRGADLRRKQMQYDVAGDLETMAAIEEHYQKSSFGEAGPGFDNDEAIFILGMPRTGTTLVERILGSHSTVQSEGELNNFAFELTRAAGPGQRTKTELVRQTTLLDFKALGKAYIASTRPNTERKAHFIDKMPLNFLYAGLIHLALPRARIINLQRNPLDTCYAIYKTLFQQAYPFSYELQELGQYYAAYQRLMSHWHRSMPGGILTVQYEELVADPETGTHKLLDFCGLPWEDACLRFYENQQSSTTASASQVRQPVYTSSVERWRDYRTQLLPLIQTLQAEGVPLEI